MKFVCLGYIDETLWNRLPDQQRQQMMDECFDYDDELRRGGHFLGGEALEAARQAVTLRTQNGAVDVTDGPYAETKEMLGGILLLEARDLNHAISLMSRHPGVKMGPFEIRPAAEAINCQIAAHNVRTAVKHKAGVEKHKQPSKADDEAAIRQLIKSWSESLEAKDLDGLVADYAPDALLFDAIPPYKTIGADNIRRLWENCLPYFPEKFRSEHRDPVIDVDGDVAFAHCLHHFVPTPADHPSGQTWMRVTACYKRLGGQWKIVHEHISIPFNPMNNQAWYIKQPEIVDMPNYCESSGCSSST